MRYYHVASEKYQTGDDLLCWCELEQAGLVTEEDWKWEEAPVGFDGDIISLHDIREGAEDFKAEFGGGSILAVDVPECEYVGKNSEGYHYIQTRIPAEWITVIGG